MNIGKFGIPFLQEFATNVICTYSLSGRARGENILLKVRMCGLNAARSVHPD